MTIFIVEADLDLVVAVFEGEKVKGECRLTGRRRLIQRAGAKAFTIQSQFHQRRMDATVFHGEGRRIQGTINLDLLDRDGGRGSADGDECCKQPETFNWSAGHQSSMPLRLAAV